MLMQKYKIPGLQSSTFISLKSEHGTLWKCRNSKFHNLHDFNFYVVCMNLFTFVCISEPLSNKISSNVLEKDNSIEAAIVIVKYTTTCNIPKASNLKCTILPSHCPSSNLSLLSYLMHSLGLLLFSHILCLIKL